MLRFPCSPFALPTRPFPQSPIFIVPSSPSPPPTPPTPTTPRTPVGPYGLGASRSAVPSREPITWGRLMRPNPPDITLSVRQSLCSVNLNFSARQANWVAFCAISKEHSDILLGWGQNNLFFCSFLWDIETLDIIWKQKQNGRQVQIHEATIRTIEVTSSSCSSPTTPEMEAARKAKEATG